MQVYGTRVQADPERPVRELVGFARVDLEAGGDRVVDIPVRTSVLDVWDVEARSWVPFVGELRLEVGAFHGDPTAIELFCVVEPV